MASQLRWFTHEASLHDRCVLLLNKYGFAGYGRYNYLLEYSCSCDGYVIPRLLVELSILLDTNEVELEAFLDDLVSYRLVEEVEGGWRPVEIKKCAEDYERIVDRNRRNAKKRWAKKSET